MYPTGTSDGSWHQVEVHMKLNTTPNVYNGIVEFWIDGVKKYSATNVDYGNPAKSGSTSPIVGFSHIKFGDNGNLWDTYNVQGCHYIDYDDIVVSATGPIGTLGSSPFPSPPTNLQIN